MKRKFINNNEEENDEEKDDNILIYSDKNHIYFYTDVTIKSCLLLNIEIKKITKEILKLSIDYDLINFNIYLHINSNGGDLLSSFSVIDTIINNKIPIISIIEGTAASAATLISVVCNKRYITENSFMLIHQLSSNNSGKYYEMNDEHKNNTKLMDSIYNIYIKYTKLSKNKLINILKNELMFNSKECLKCGLIDEIYKKNI